MPRFNSWSDFMQAVAGKSYARALLDEVKREREKFAVYPPPDQVHRAFDLCSLGSVKVVLLGQDPYHQPGQAHGLAFSYVGVGSLPYSLIQIFKALELDVPGALDERKRRCITQRRDGLDGDLSPWARQGVLLLNAGLTVRRGAPGSHLDFWRPFTDDAIRAVVDSAEVPPHFVLLGGTARDTFMRVVVNGGASKAIEKVADDVFSTNGVTFTQAPHPSARPPLQKKFLESKVFSKANGALQLRWGARPGSQIDWRLS